MTAEPSQLDLVADPIPLEVLERWGIRYLLGSNEDGEFHDAIQGAELVIADPPWKYGQKFGEGLASDHYAGQDTSMIEEQLENLSYCGANRLALWITNPLLDEFVAATIHGIDSKTGKKKWWRWGAGKTGGTWSKNNYGPGYHWAGSSELVRIYTRGSGPCDRNVYLKNTWEQAPDRIHSFKPIAWMRQWLRRWTTVGGLVVDPYAGLGSVAIACLLEGRRYVGVEIDPKRHEDGRRVLARYRSWGYEAGAGAT